MLVEHNCHHFKSEMLIAHDSVITIGRLSSPIVVWWSASFIAITVKYCWPLIIDCPTLPRFLCLSFRTATIKFSGLVVQSNHCECHCSTTMYLITLDNYAWLLHIFLFLLFLLYLAMYSSYFLLCNALMFKHCSSTCLGCTKPPREPRVTSTVGSHYQEAFSDAAASAGAKQSIFFFSIGFANSLTPGLANSVRSGYWMQLL